MIDQTSAQRAHAEPPHVDRAAMARLLAGPNAAYRARVRAFFEQAEGFDNYDDEELGAWRDKILAYARTVLGADLITLRDLVERPSRFFDLHEHCIWVDGSLGAVIYASFLLFGGSIAFLGTERHAELGRGVETLAIPGSIMMTEIGHGTNVRQIETTCRYDPQSDELVVHTPSLSAAKWSAALMGWSARGATLFARLILPDGRDVGVHPVFVPIRRPDGSPYPGVTTVDSGQLGGLNGVGIGGVAFDNLRVPRTNLLNRYADILPDGVYTTFGLSAGERFQRTMAPLMLERVVPFPQAGCKYLLTVATRFSHERRQFGPAGQPEVPIITYTSHQRRLMPGIARTYAMALMTLHIGEVVDQLARDGKALPEWFHTLSAGVKAVHYEYALRTMRDARECCSVQSWRQRNKASRFVNDMQGFYHAGGDNVVLLQQVAQNLLREAQLRKIRGEELTSPPALGRGPVSDLAWQQHVLASRAGHLVALLYQRIAEASLARRDFYEAWNDSLPLALRAAKAYIEAQIHQQFHDVVEREAGGPNAAPLRLLCQLYGCEVIADDLGWLLSELPGHLPAASAAARLDEATGDLCRALTPASLDLVGAFDIPARFLPATSLVGDLGERFGLGA